MARALLARRERVRVLVRAGSPRTNLERLDCEVAEGDMRSPVDMVRAMDGVKRLYHVAADYRLWARDPREIVRNNLAGAEAVMHAALAAKVERIVYTSSVATLEPKAAILRTRTRRSPRPRRSEPTSEQSRRRTAGGADGRRAAACRR